MAELLRQPHYFLIQGTTIMSSLQFFVILSNYSRFPFMNLKIIISASLIAISSIALCQTETSINQTDSRGRKQGHWIKKYPDQTILYEGYFKDDHPVGEFRRYYEDKTLKSVLQFSNRWQRGKCHTLSSKREYCIKREICKPEERGKMAILFCNDQRLSYF